METYRIFIAVEVTPLMKEYAAELQRDLQRFKCRIAWTKSEGMHLTFKFLGETEISLIEDIKKLLAPAVSEHQSFILKSDKAGHFGGSRPKVLWLGFKPSINLSKLAVSVDKAVNHLGFETEKRELHPHLTLGRVKDISGTRELLDNIYNIKTPDFSVPINEVVLFRSQLNSQGAVYTALERYPLQSPGIFDI
ncbi:RNA 2',3'-cyclic phosphodiesterase [bacterium]|nr:RNA 2',3'-cyclic phosphodiesterase [bacterium]